MRDEVQKKDQEMKKKDKAIQELQAELTLLRTMSSAIGPSKVRYTDTKTIRVMQIIEGASSIINTLNRGDDWY